MTLLEGVILFLILAILVLSGFIWTIYGIGKFIQKLDENRPPDEDDQGFYCTGPDQNCSCKTDNTEDE